MRPSVTRFPRSGAAEPGRFLSTASLVRAVSKGPRSDGGVEVEERPETPARGGRARSAPAWVRRALLVARVNLVRQFRTAKTHRWFAFAYLFSLGFGLLVAVGRAPLPLLEAWPYPGGYALGGQFAAGDPATRATAVDRVRGFAGVLFVLLALMTVIKEATEGAMDGHVDALVLAAGARSVAVGGVCWSLLQTGSQFGLIVVAGAVAFGVGAGSPLAGVTLLVAGGCLLLAAVPVGFVVAMLVRLAFQRVSVVRRQRVVVGAPLAVVYFGLFARARYSMRLLAASPLGWFADLGFAPLGAAAPAGALGALGLAAVGFVGGTAAGVPLATRLWLGDDARSPEETAERETTAKGHVTEGALDRLAGRRVAAVARATWLRVRREPRSLIFAAMSAGIAASAGVEIVDRVPAALPAVVAVYGGTTVGMGATLNPLGAAGVGLPAALTAPHGGRALVRGYALSAALPGAPLVAVVTLGAGLATGLSLVVVVALALLGALLAATAAVVSLSVGLAVPNVEGLRPTGSGLRPPKLLATTLFLVVMAAVGAPAFVGVGLGGVGGPTLVSGLAGVAVTAVVALAVGGLAYRRALANTAGYRIE